MKIKEKLTNWSKKELRDFLNSCAESCCDYDLKTGKLIKADEDLPVFCRLNELIEQTEEMDDSTIKEINNVVDEELDKLECKKTIIEGIGRLNAWSMNSLSPFGSVIDEFSEAFLDGDFDCAVRILKYNEDVLQYGCGDVIDIYYTKRVREAVDKWLEKYAGPEKEFEIGDVFVFEDNGIDDFEIGVVSRVSGYGENSIDLTVFSFKSCDGGFVCNMHEENGLGSCQQPDGDPYFIRENGGLIYFWEKSYASEMPYSLEGNVKFTKDGFDAYRKLVLNVNHSFVIE